MKNLTTFHPEVEDALRARHAVVALETTLISHGFPAGEGAAVGRESERRVRAAGAIPATIGILDGRLRIGLTDDELQRFDEAGATARKVGPRDLGACIAQGALGATTVGGTLAAMRVAGIGFMGTGGLGGVHRGFPDAARRLGRPRRARRARRRSSSRPGVKSLLDVPATAEVLETLGVPVLGWRTDTMPLFYAADGGPPVSARVETADEAARIADAHWRLGRHTALVLGRPPDESLDVEPLIQEALAAADREHVSRPGRHAVRPRLSARALRRAHRRREQGARRRERRPRRRGRGRLRGDLSGAARREVVHDVHRDGDCPRTGTCRSPTPSRASTRACPRARRRSPRHSREDDRDETLGRA